MAELKTKATTQDVTGFMSSITPQSKQEDGFSLLKLFSEITNKKPVLWGSRIVGFGKYHYKSEKSSQEGDWPLVGFSVGKQKLSLYIMHGNSENPLLASLGKHTEGMGCLYLNKLSDVDSEILKKLIKHAYEYMKKTHTEVTK